MALDLGFIDDILMDVVDAMVSIFSNPLQVDYPKSSTDFISLRILAFRGKGFPVRYNHNRAAYLI
jgi:hypothetical protein